MSYRCGVGPGAAVVLGVEPGPPRIKCDTCGTTREIGVNRAPPTWFLDGKAVPGWKLERDGDKRIDTCGRCRLSAAAPPGGQPAANSKDPTT